MVIEAMCRSRDLPKLLGAVPAKRARFDLTFPVFQVPQNNIVMRVIENGGPIFVWPLVPEGVVTQGADK